MVFGRINHFMLIGGGGLLADLSLKLIKRGSKVTVITDERHAGECIYVRQNRKIVLRDFLTLKNIDFIVSRNVNADNNVLKKITKQTLGISIGAAWIFKDKFINRFEDRLINLHGSRLPQDRGGGGFSWRILRNDSLGFSVIHLIDSGIDTGYIVKYKEFFYPHLCRLPRDYHDYSIKQYLILFDEFLDDLKNNKEFMLMSQQEYLSTYWPRLFTDIHGYIDWSWCLRDIEQFICAFDDPYNGAISFINGTKMRLKRCYSIASDGIFHPFQKGIVYKISSSGLFVATEEGSLIISRITDDNGLDMIDKIRAGDRFYTPPKYLDEAKQYRAVYTPEGLKK